jgi:hypothetical protein
MWYNRLLCYAPLTSAEVETVHFDTQKMVKPEITGVDYQQGSLAGIRTGDLVNISQPKGQYRGDYLSRVSAIKTASHYLSIQINKKQIWFSAKLATIVQRDDGSDAVLT